MVIPERWRLSSRRWRRMTLQVLAVIVPVVVVLLAKTESDHRFYLALLGCAGLPWRNRWPRISLVLCLPGVAGGLGWPPMIVAMFALGRAKPCFRHLAVWIALITVVALVPVFVTQHLRPADYVLTLAFVLFIVIIPMALGALVTTRQQLRESLEQLREATEAELSAKAETARAEERARITREIHDAVGHHVTLIAVEAAALAATTENPTTAETATRVRGLAKEAMSEMRTALGLATEHPPQTASLQTIPDLVERARETGLQVSLISDFEAQGVSPTVGRAAFRVVQEALTNVSKHAPGAGVAVELHGHNGSLHVTVSNGVPVGRFVDMGRGGSGLEGLSERVGMVGGRLEAGPSEDGGFELKAILPRDP